MNRFVRALLSLAGALLVAGSGGTADVDEIEYVGAETCLTCHDDLEAWAARSPHGTAAFEAVSDRGCETCHGPGGLHADDPENSDHQLRMERWTSIQATGTCLSCHGDTHPRFRATSHALAGVTCSDCHSVHAKSGWTHDLDDREPFATVRISGVSATCASCHEDVAAEFGMPQSHPLQSGALDCTSCHDPHAPATRTHLAAFGQRECAGCHADKNGPFVFEHGSVMVESCTACHTPHGSNNRHLLTFQKTAELCYSCHDFVPGFHLGFSPVGPPSFGLNTNCTACHSTIHGSNFDPFFLK